MLLDFLGQWIVLKYHTKTETHFASNNLKKSMDPRKDLIPLNNNFEESACRSNQL